MNQLEGLSQTQTKRSLDIKKNKSVSRDRKSSNLGLGAGEVRE